MTTSAPSIPPNRRLLTRLDRIDPFPYRLDDHHRTSKDTSLLRAQTKSKGHGGVLPRLDPYLHEMDLYRVPRGSVRHSHSVWRLLRDHRRLCARFACRRTVHRHDRRQNRPWKTKCRTPCLDGQNIESQKT